MAPTPETNFRVELTTGNLHTETIDNTPPDDRRARFEIEAVIDGCIYLGDCSAGSYYTMNLVNLPVNLVQCGLTQKQAAQILSKRLGDGPPVWNDFVAALESGCVQQWPGPMDVEAFLALHQGNDNDNNDEQIPF